jgi:hypothetical protein
MAMPKVIPAIVFFVYQVSPADANAVSSATARLLAFVSFPLQMRREEVSESREGTMWFDQADPNAQHWSEIEVAHWAWAVDGGGADLVEALNKHKVDGAVLLHIGKADIEEDLGITGIRAKKLFIAIQKLKDSYDGPEEFGMPKLTFDQYRKMNRNAMDRFIVALLASPRTALQILDELPFDAQPRAKVSWLELVFCPQYFFYKHHEEIAGGIPLMHRYFLLTNIFSHIVFLGAAALGKRWAIQCLRNNLLMDAIGMFFNLATKYVIYPYTPWLICDLVFYCVNYILPLAIMSAATSFGLVLGLMQAPQFGPQLMSLIQVQLTQRLPQIRAPQLPIQRSAATFFTGQAHRLME